MLSWKWNEVKIFVMQLLLFGEFANRLGAMSDKVCIGTDDIWYSRFTDFEARFKGCTHIVGNFELITYDIDSLANPEEHLSFLGDIQEITGYLYIAWTKCKNLSFSSLRIVRGRSVFRVHVDDPEYAILVTRSTIKHLELPALTEVSNGSIGMYFMTRMCNLESLNWNDILMDSRAQYHYYPAYDRTRWIYWKGSENELGDGCEPCNASCTGGCWGKEGDQCQNLSKVHCHSNCGGGRCYGRESGECCHSACAGGCTGPSRKDCLTCKNAYFDGECQDGCPPGKYSLSTKCVSSCPSNSVVDEEILACLLKCPPGKYPRNGKCKTVHPPDKLCQQPSIWRKVHSGTIEYFRNCTIWDRNIEIDRSTFSGPYIPKNFTFAQWEKPLHPERLAIFKTLREISGSLAVTSVLNSHFVYLDAFENLESIGGRYATSDTGTIMLKVSQTPLQSVNFRKLRAVHGHVVFSDNKELCYVNTVKWTNITAFQWRITISGNRPSEECKLDKKVCSSKCPGNGCWGPQLQDCVCLDTKLCETDVQKSANWEIFGVVVLLTISVGVVYGFKVWRARITGSASEDMNLKMLAPAEQLNLPPNLNKLRTIDKRKLRKDHILGKGAFGTVYKGFWMPSDGIKIPVAVKVLHATVAGAESSGFVNEAFLMAGILHPNLLRILGLSLDASKMMLVSQVMPLGCMLNYPKSNSENIGSEAMLSWCTQIAMGMEHLETNRIIHRDLAARNVLMETPNSIKITDFGLAQLLNITEEDYQGKNELLPLRWLALECCSDFSFSHKSDVWAFGVTVWEILTCGEIPFGNVPLVDVPTLVERGERLEQPDNCTIDLYRVLIKTWMPDAESRPSFQELVIEFSKMCEDPGRYLVIENDTLRRLPKYTLEDEKKLLYELTTSQDRPEDFMTVEQYVSVICGDAEYTNYPSSSTSVTPYINHGDLKFIR